ncbi:MAG: (d)CMP kinase [Bacillota bacterium]
MSECCPFPMAIAIDGPAGAGKSTVAKMLANRLRFCHIDTGAMYRAITLAALRLDLDLDNDQQVAKLAEHLELDIRPASDTMHIFLNGEDITELIRDPSVSANVSRVARLASVRSQLVRWQRQLAQSQCVVMDGRDIGTHVLPDAPLKVFLTASLAERARRRMQELADKGLSTAISQVQADIATRDEIDSKREASPLARALDAVEIDTSQLSAEQAVEKILHLAKIRGIKKPTGE